MTDSLTSLTYDALLANFEYSLSSTVNGLQLLTVGFNETTPKLLRRLLTHFSTSAALS